MKKVNFSIEYAGLHLAVGQNEAGQDVPPSNHSPTCSVCAGNGSAKR